jgi:hypothetical protein
MPRISKTHYKRIAENTGAALLAAVAVCVGPSAPAHATSIDVECVGSFGRSFSPAVTTTSQSVTVTEANDYNTCVIGSTASGAATLTLDLSCVPVTAGPAEDETVTWNDATGGTSTISWGPPPSPARPSSTRAPSARDATSETPPPRSRPGSATSAAWSDACSAPRSPPPPA